ncbi:MAG: hypothetical protein H0S85_00560 [Desulfovibrionaceae bacterium]|jgi:hypothetical protein|nr:hypothetical protein [Desulfovibrionaceae bacterium]
MIDKLHDFYENLAEDGVVFCFSGPATQGVLESIGEALKRKLELEAAGLTATQRVFSLFVELMQNIIRYSAERAECGSAEPFDAGPADGPANIPGEDCRSGVVVVGRSDARYFVLCGNVGPLDRCLGIRDAIAMLGAMAPEELKAHYKRMRRETRSPESRGAGLGLIEMARQSSEPLQCHVKPLGSETAFVSIRAVG